MDKRATYEDATLVLDLYEKRRETRLREARAWFAASFHVRTVEELQALCPTGSDANASFRMVTTYWDMAASFVTAGILNEDLFFQSSRELLLVWERVKDIAPALRESRQDPGYLGNLEAVAGFYVEWLNARSPRAYAAFAAVVRSGYKPAAPAR